MAFWESFRQRYAEAQANGIQRRQAALNKPNIATPVVTEGWKSALQAKGYVQQPTSDFNNFTKFANAQGKTVYCLITCCQCRLKIGRQEPFSVSKSEIVNYINNNL